MFVGAMVYIGDVLGYFKVLSTATEGSPMSATKLAAETGTDERYALEWLRAVVTAEYVEANSTGDLFFMTADQTTIFVDEKSGKNMVAEFALGMGSVLAVPKVIEQGFRKGGGVSYEQLGPEVSNAIRRMHSVMFEQDLPKWFKSIPELSFLFPPTETPSPPPATPFRILDVGCGYGDSTLAMAKLWPHAHIVGLDCDETSLKAAQTNMEQAGVKNVSFVCDTIHHFGQSSADQTQSFDFVLAFHCIHDMPQPGTALKAIRNLLSTTNKSACFLWCEPGGDDNPLNNRNLGGRIKAAISPLHCLTVSKALGAEGLGTVIGPQRARKLAVEQGTFDNDRVKRLVIEDNESLFMLLGR
eukprot:m.75125 g.75125  ORF g.75125 m.75125 type:complete len:356 (+) comp20490_c0_seq2:250-1317(+)